MDPRAVGFIGLGRMGGAMATNLAKAGVPLAVHDASPEAVKRLTELDAGPCETPREVASRARLVFLCLPFSPEVEDVLFGEAGALTQPGDGLAIVDTTTMNYHSVVEIAGKAEAAGVSYSDCPISGMPFRAENGTLTMMFGGTGEAFERTRPYLDVMGEFIVHCGECGKGQMMKAINNIIYNVNIAALCEVMPLAVKAGLAPERVAEVVTSASARSFASEYFVPRILDRKFDSDFSMQAAYKDIVNVQEIAERIGASMPVVDAMVGTYEKAIGMGFGDEPKSAMVKVYEDALGQEVRRGRDVKS